MRGAVVLRGTIEQSLSRPGKGGEMMIAGLRLIISGGRNPSERSTRMTVPGAGCKEIVMKWIE